MNWFGSVFRRKAEAAAPAGREALDAKLRLAYDHILRGEVAEAERLFRALLEEDARDADALFFLSVIALATDRALEALDLSQKAIDVRPNDAGLWFVLAVARRSLRLLEDAVDA